MPGTKIRPGQAFQPIMQGFLLNGKIVPSVASNNLTVAIKTLAGADPSTDDPVYVRIGDTVRAITAALSVTKNAGTNWANAGSAEFAAKEIDWFVYLGYNTTDGVVIGFSRIPFARQYSDFSATTTNEKYAAISTITTAASTDYYELIGRFAATLGVSASYNWSVPTFTANNLINRPIYETRWLTWQPVFTGFSVNPTGAQRYMIRERNCFYTVFGMTNGTSNANSFTLTLPMAAAQGGELGVIIFVNNGSTLPTTPGHANYGGNNTLTLYVSWSGTAWTASGNKNAYVPTTMYEI